MELVPVTCDGIREGEEVVVVADDDKTLGVAVATISKADNELEKALEAKTIPFGAAAEDATTALVGKNRAPEVEEATVEIKFGGMTDVEDGGS